MNITGISGSEARSIYKNLAYLILILLLTSTFGAPYFAKCENVNINNTHDSLFDPRSTDTAFSITSDGNLHFFEIQYQGLTHIITDSKGVILFKSNITINDFMYIDPQVEAMVDQMDNIHLLINGLYGLYYLKIGMNNTIIIQEHIQFPPSKIFISSQAIVADQIGLAYIIFSVEYRANYSNEFFFGKFNSVTTKFDFIKGFYSPLSAWTHSYYPTISISLTGTIFIATLDWSRNDSYHSIIWQFNETALNPVPKYYSINSMNFNATNWNKRIFSILSNDEMDIFIPDNDATNNTIITRIKINLTSMKNISETKYNTLGETNEKYPVGPENTIIDFAIARDSNGKIRILTARHFDSYYFSVITYCVLDPNSLSVQEISNVISANDIPSPSNKSIFSIFRFAIFGETSYATYYYGTWQNINSMDPISQYLWIKQYPDLSLNRDNIQIFPDPIMDAVSFQITIPIINIGDIQSSTSELQISLDGKSYSDLLIPSIPSGGQYPMTITLNLSKGTYNLGFNIIGTNPIEINVDNNYMLIHINVLSPPRIILHVDAFIIKTFDTINLSVKPVSGDNISRVLFEFGDGNNTGLIEQLSTSYRYPQNGRYQIIARAMDEKANIGPADSVIIIVENQNPIINISSSSKNYYVGEVVFLDGSRSIDTDGIIVNWTWFLSNQSAANERNVSHIFFIPGQYIIKLVIIDDDGGRSESEYIITIVDKRVEKSIVIPCSLLLIFGVICIILFIRGYNKRSIRIEKISPVIITL